jgi:hypothetical protein
VSRETVHTAIFVFLRLALGVTFLAAVTDRFGLWGSPGSPNVAWGDLHRFAAHTATLNPWAALGSGALLLLFALGGDEPERSRS